MSQNVFETPPRPVAEAPSTPCCARSQAIDAAADWILQELGRQSQDILCATERARYSLRATAQLMERLASIKDSGRRQHRLIQDSLDYLALQAGTVTLQAAPVSVQTLVGQALAAVREQAEAHAVFLSTQVQAEVPETVVSDAACLQKVLVALLQNAVDLTENGSVNLGVEVRADSDRQARSLAFSVLDTGCGLRPAQLQALGQPLAESLYMPGVPPHRTLRLQVAQRRVRLLGGELRIESIGGLGTHAHFALPMA